MSYEKFMNNLADNLNVSITENGAKGYETTNKKLLDLNYQIGSARQWGEDKIGDTFMLAYNEDPITALRWLFFARDVRGGLGERRFFRICIKKLTYAHADVVKRLIPLIAEYGRWDDVVELITVSSVKNAAVNIIKKQLLEDMTNLKLNKSISLCAKWLPSPNTSSEKTVLLAKKLYKSMNITERDYRKMLVKLRTYLNVVEQKMSAKEWDKIDYEAVPSKANLNYKEAFLRNDKERRKAYLESLKKGEVTINANVAFPHEIVHSYNFNLSKDDPTLEAMWKSLPDLVQGNNNTIVVADGSWSMTTPVDKNSHVTALQVANALAIYFSERQNGIFKNKYITFSRTPEYVDFKGCSSLREKLKMAYEHDECSNTNIEAVFDLILETAVDNNLSQQEIPANILIISDGEFDSMTCSNHTTEFYSYNRTKKTTLFKEIANRYETFGYKLPRLIFWNTNSKTCTIPVKENENGVALVSGFSVNVCKMVLSGELDPYKCLLEVINATRYDAVEAAYRGE